MTDIGDSRILGAQPARPLGRREGPATRVPDGERVAAQALALTRDDETLERHRDTGRVMDADRVLVVRHWHRDDPDASEWSRGLECPNEGLVWLIEQPVQGGLVRRRGGTCVGCDMEQPIVVWHRGTVDDLLAPGADPLTRYVGPDDQTKVPVDLTDAIVIRA